MTARPDARPWGTGSVYLFRGRWRARLPGRYGRKPVDGSYATRAEAEAALAAALEMLAAAPIEAPTLASFGEDWLKDGVRDVRAKVLERDRSRWSTYIEGAPVATMPIVEVEAYDVEQWLAKLRGERKPQLAAQTKQNALSLLRGALEAARERGGPLHGRPNPAADVSLGKRERQRTRERWTWLRAPQIDAVLDARDLPPKSRLVFTIAIYTGLRAGELWGLRVEDVDLDRGVLHVRHSRAEATKGGEPREVPLLPPARDALRQWLALRTAAGVRSHLGLVWPAPHGGHHAEGYDAGWSEHAEGLGLGHATFHDIRHTCASHLVMGTWAPAYVERALRIEEVKSWLGHRDITTTQRYAHLAPESIAGLVQRGPRRTKKRIVIKSRALRSGTQVGTQSEAASGIRTPDLRFTKAQRDHADSTGFAGVSPDVSRLVSRLRRAAERAGDAIARSDPHRDHRAIDLVEAAVAIVEALEAAAPGGAKRVG
jgi:integrase